MTFDLTSFSVKLYDEILANGLCRGPGGRNKQVCIEAAICLVLGLPHDDDPKCVTHGVRMFNIFLNDCDFWLSPQSRAQGLRDLGIAQLGSLGAIGGKQFSDNLTPRILAGLLPSLLREARPENELCLRAAHQCERSLNFDINASKLSSFFPSRLYRPLSSAFQYASEAALGFSVDFAAEFAFLARGHELSDKTLRLAASLALNTLKELNSPGVKLL